MLCFFDGPAKQLNVDRITNHQATIIHELVVGDAKIPADNLQLCLKNRAGSGPGGRLVL